MKTSAPINSFGIAFEYFRPRAPRLPTSTFFASFFDHFGPIPPRLTESIISGSFSNISGQGYPELQNHQLGHNCRQFLADAKINFRHYVRSFRAKAAQTAEISLSSVMFDHCGPRPPRLSKCVVWHNVRPFWANAVDTWSDHSDLKMHTAGK